MWTRKLKACIQQLLKKTVSLHREATFNKSLSSLTAISKQKSKLLCIPVPWELPLCPSVVGTAEEGGPPQVLADDAPQQSK